MLPLSHLLPFPMPLTSVAELVVNFALANWSAVVKVIMFVGCFGYACKLSAIPLHCDDVWCDRFP